MAKSAEKKKKPQKPAVRQVRFSLKYKITLLVFVLIILTAAAVSNLVIRMEDRVFRDQLADTTRVYMETFRKNAEYFYILDETGESTNTVYQPGRLIDFLKAFREVPSFRRAMLIDNSGNIQIDTEPDSLYGKVYDISMDRARALSSDGVTLFERIDTNTNESSRVVTNRRRSVETRTNRVELAAAGTNGEPPVVSNVVTRVTNEKVEIVTNRRTEIVVRMRTYEGWTPLYLPVLLENDSRLYITSNKGGGITTNSARFSLRESFSLVNDYMKLHESGRLFRTGMLGDEAVNGMMLARDFERLFSAMIGPAATNRDFGLSRATNAGISPDDFRFLRIVRKQLEEYRAGNDLLLSEPLVLQLVQTMQKMGLPQKDAARYLLLRQNQKKLFSNPDVFTEEQKANLRYLDFAERFAAGLLTPEGRPLPRFERLLSTMRNINPDYRKFFEPDAVVDRIRSLQTFALEASAYRDGTNVFSVWRTSPSADPREGENNFHLRLEQSFADIKAAYRVGTVRIILNLEKLRVEQKRIAGTVVDIAVMIILRVLVITFLFVGFLIAPLQLLSDETDAIARGDLDKRIEIASHDEIGQLADRFHLMAKSLKKYIQEVRDKARMEEELLTAKEIQDTLLPKSFPAVTGWNFSVHYEPESESGGDFYDFIPVDDTHFGIVVADVTGHGVRAGIVMAMFMSALRTFGAKRIDAGRVIRDINPILLRDTPPNMFASVFYGVVDHEKREMYYSIAGHNPGILYHPDDGQIRLMKTGGMPVGMVEGAIFDPLIELYKVPLRKGEIFLQYTDGITEAKSKADEEFGEDRFYAAIRKNYSADLDAMRDGIVADLKGFTAGAAQSDDITLMIMRVG
jgi:serine phosphatase RsbU (regulator of sigma subunit)